jgi:hypothetical protein
MARDSGQHGRKAFGTGRTVSKRALAVVIANSIRTHAAHGVRREISAYTQNEETQRLVTALLAA